MALRKFLLATWCLLVCTAPILGQNNGATDNEPEFFKFDLKNRAIGSVVKQPELVLPNGNSYAQRVESDLSIDIPGVTENFLVKVDAAIDSVITDVTNNPLDGRTLLEQKGLKIDPLAIASSSDVFLQQYTPIVGGQSSNITNYHLVEECILSVNPDIILHLAAQPLVRQSYSSPLHTFSVNTQGTANILEAARKLDKKCSVVIINQI